MEFKLDRPIAIQVEDAYIARIVRKREKLALHSDQQIFSSLCQAGRVFNI